MTELQVAYTLEIQGVIGIEEDKWTREKLEDHLNTVSNVDLTIEGVTMYHPDGVEVTYLDLEDDDDQS